MTTLRDLRLGQMVTMTGEIHTLDATMGDELLPPNQVMVTMLVTLGPEPHVQGSDDRG
jgi:hypothetical protein